MVTDGMVHLAEVPQGSAWGDCKEVPDPFLGMEGHRSVAGLPVEEKSGRGAAVEVDGSIDPPTGQGTRRGEAFREFGEGERAQGGAKHPVPAPSPWR
jgi:hypothetical protein